MQAAMLKCHDNTCINLHAIHCACETLQVCTKEWLHIAYGMSLFSNCRIGWWWDVSNHRHFLHFNGGMCRYEEKTNQ